MKHTYLALLRGINVGVKNRVSMAELKSCLETLGYEDVRTYLASGNVIFRSPKTAAALTEEIQQTLPKKFTLENNMISVLVLPHDQLRQIVAQAPKDFGSQPDVYYSDVIFLLNVTPAEAFGVFRPREGVDKVWQGKLAIYSQRLGAERTKSRLSAIMASPLYKKMTIRTWNTAVTALGLMDAMEQR